MRTNLGGDESSPGWEEMTKKSIRTAIYLLPLFLFLTASQLMSAEPMSRYLEYQELPQYWELRIKIRLKVNYEVKENERTHNGRFTLETEWVGCFEEDEDDFLMYSIDQKLTEWEAQEKTKGNGGMISLETKDFPEAPELDLHYILKVEDSVVFNFVIPGFEVPLAASVFKQMLLLPATKENSKVNPDDLYTPHLVKGNNQVRLPLKQFFGDRTTASFSWSWKDRKTTQRKDMVVLFDQAHDAEVQVTVVPHYKDE